MSSYENVKSRDKELASVNIIYNIRCASFQCLESNIIYSLDSWVCRKKGIRGDTDIVTLKDGIKEHGTYIEYLWGDSELDIFKETILKHLAYDDKTNHIVSYTKSMGTIVGGKYNKQTLPRPLVHGKTKDFTQKDLEDHGIIYNLATLQFQFMKDDTIYSLSEIDLKALVHSPSKLSPTDLKYYIIKKGKSVRHTSSSSYLTPFKELLDNKHIDIYEDQPYMRPDKDLNDAYLKKDIGFSLACMRHERKDLKDKFPHPKVAIESVEDWAARTGLNYKKKQSTVNMDRIKAKDNKSKYKKGKFGHKVHIKNTPDIKTASGIDIIPSMWGQAAVDALKSQSMMFPDTKPVKKHKKQTRQEKRDIKHREKLSKVEEKRVAKRRRNLHRVAKVKKGTTATVKLFRAIGFGMLTSAMYALAWHLIRTYV